MLVKQMAGQSLSGAFNFDGVDIRVTVVTAGSGYIVSVPEYHACVEVRSLDSVAGAFTGYTDVPADRADMIQQAVDKLRKSYQTVEVGNLRHPVLYEVNGRKVIAEMPYSGHPEDSYLTLVLAVYEGQYVTWCKNLEAGGFHYGHYLDQNAGEAIQDFVERRTKRIVEGFQIMKDMQVVDMAKKVVTE